MIIAGLVWPAEHYYRINLTFCLNTIAGAGWPAEDNFRFSLTCWTQLQVQFDLLNTISVSVWIAEHNCRCSLTCYTISVSVWLAEHNCRCSLTCWTQFQFPFDLLNTIVGAVWPAEHPSGVHQGACWGEEGSAQEEPGHHCQVSVPSMGNIIVFLIRILVGYLSF